MRYERINDSEIRILPDTESADEVLEIMARVSYTRAKPVQLGFLAPHKIPNEEMDFSQFVDLNSKIVLKMDYVNGRQCKTEVHRDNGDLIFNAWLHERDRGAAEFYLDHVIAELEASN